MSENIEKIQINGENTQRPVGLRNLYITNKGNLCLETSSELNNTSKGKINIESMSDILIKPTDDINIYSTHREPDKLDEVSIKVLGEAGGKDIPVKLLLNLASATLTTKGSGSNVLDVNINKEPGVRGYLKVRAQAIDLRCEDHGGIAILPKGTDSDGNMNKIKFEHGGGDGLEFGTFNTAKTSLFTTEYRFNKVGEIKLATRTTITREDSDPKKDPDDNTTHQYYLKLEDDFYDIIDPNDPTCTWEDIIKFVVWAKNNNFGPWEI